MKRSQPSLSSLAVWVFFGVTASVLSALWRPYGLLVVTAALLVGGAMLFLRSHDERMRMMAIGAFAGGAVGVFLVIVSIGSFAFAGSVREGRGVETRLPGVPLQRAPTVTPTSP